MLRESQVKFHSPQNISGASQQNNIAAFSLTTEVDGDLFQEVKKTTGKKSQNIKWLHMFGVKAQRSQKWFDVITMLFTPLNTWSKEGSEL